VKYLSSVTAEETQGTLSIEDKSTRAIRGHGSGDKGARNISGHGSGDKGTRSIRGHARGDKGTRSQGPRQRE
jgi:hypothetical protein